MAFSADLESRRQVRDCQPVAKMSFNVQDPVPFNQSLQTVNNGGNHKINQATHAVEMSLIVPICWPKGSHGGIQFLLLNIGKE